MFTVTKRFDFSAAHQLPDHDGKCKNLHGHNYYVEVSVSSRDLITEGPQRGMVVDLGILSAIGKQYCVLTDHKFLNDFIDYPTAEVLAKDIYEFFLARLGSQSDLSRIAITTVKVQETDSGWATWTNVAGIVELTK